jgi:hypothetical protein
MKIPSRKRFKERITKIMVSYLIMEMLNDYEMFPIGSNRIK